MAKKLSAEIWERRINEAGAGRYEFIRWTVDGEVGALKKCAVRCVKDGYEWISTPNSLVSGGSGCPQCSGNRRWTADDRVLQINKLNNIEFVSWVARYNGKDSKANVRCAIDGFEWSASVHSLVNSGSGCPHCSGNRRFDPEEREDQINELDNIRFVSWIDGYKNIYSKANVRCAIDGFGWSASVHNLVNHGSGCPQCVGRRRWTSDERIEQINSLENIEFVSWVDGYENSYSKANVRCTIDGFEWSAAVNYLVNNGSGCPHCSGKRKWTQYERIYQINSLDNIEFASWVDGYENSYSKANVRCTIDGFEWSAAVNDLVNKGSGCPHCSGNRRWTADERIYQINSLDNIEFVSWVDGYNGVNSKANVRCSVDNFEWRSSVNDLVNGGYGCPKCAKYGYDKSKTGTLYALRSECGMYVKIGISNDPKRRHRDLEKRTPFKFGIVEQISGDGAKIAALEKYLHNKYERAGFVGFDGCTEWLICTPELLEELRNLGDKQ